MAEEFDFQQLSETEQVQTINSEYDQKYGFHDSEENYSFKSRKGLDAEIVTQISRLKNEPEWMLQWRLDAFARWKELKEPDWAMVDYPAIDYQDQYYYARPKSMEVKPRSLDEVDPKLLATYEKLVSNSLK